MHPRLNSNFSRMPYIFIYILLLSVVLLLHGCHQKSNVAGDVFTAGEKQFFGYVGLKLEHRTYPIDTPVLVTFYYGHKEKDDQQREEPILNHVVQVYVANYFKTPTHTPNTFLELHHIFFDGEDFFSDENAVLNERIVIGQKIRYQQSFDLEIDFSNMPIDHGILVIHIKQTFSTPDQVNNMLLAEAYERQFLYFKIEQNQVTFNWRQMS